MLYCVRMQVMPVSEETRVRHVDLLASECPDLLRVRDLFVERAMLAPVTSIAVSGSGTPSHAHASATSHALGNAAVCTVKTTAIGSSISHAGNTPASGRSSHSPGHSTGSGNLLSYHHFAPPARLRASSPIRQSSNPSDIYRGAISMSSNHRLNLVGGLSASAPLVLYMMQDAPVWGDMFSEVISRGTGLPEPIARQLFFHLVGAVRYLHAHGLVCGDIRLGRIFFADQQKYLPSNIHPFENTFALAHLSLN